MLMGLTLTNRKSQWKAGSVLITNALKHSMLLKLKRQKDFGLTQLPGLA
jgi:ABC-type iron transport system FetAB permease component